MPRPATVAGRVVGALVVLTASLGAQGLPVPSAHWGAIMLPGIRDTREWGLHFSGFTQFGKEPDSTGRRYAFLPYNEIDKTYGFNLLTFSRLDNAWRGPHRKRGSSVNTAGYARRVSFVVGVVDDHVPEFLQNTVIHQGNLRGEDKLWKVPRSTADSVNRPSLGPTEGVPVLGASAEYFLRLSYETEEYGERERAFTPLFVGAGASVGTLNQDLFVHAGSSYSTLKTPWADLGWIRMPSLGGGMMLRAGVLAPGYYFRDVASNYVSAQASGRVRLEFWDFPVDLEYALTASSGMFVAARSTAQLAEIEARGEPARKVYFAKIAIPERFRSIRLRIGQFTFETFNDSPGGKDKGPSFGASVTLDTYRAARERLP